MEIDEEPVLQVLLHQKIGIHIDAAIVIDHSISHLGKACLTLLSSRRPQCPAVTPHLIVLLGKES